MDNFLGKYINFQLWAPKEILNRLSEKNGEKYECSGVVQWNTGIHLATVSEINWVKRSRWKQAVFCGYAPRCLGILVTSLEAAWETSGSGCFCWKKLGLWGTEKRELLYTTEHYFVPFTFVIF